MGRRHGSVSGYRARSAGAPGRRSANWLPGHKDDGAARAFPAAFNSLCDGSTEIRYGFDAKFPVTEQFRLIGTLEGVHRFESSGSNVTGQVVGLGGFNLGIMSTTEHPEEAFKVLEYFVSQDDRLFPEFGYLPTRSDVELPLSGIEKKDAALAVFQEQLQYAQPRGPHPEWQKISKAIYDAEQAALTGQMTPDEALSQAQKTIDTILN